MRGEGGVTAMEDVTLLLVAVVGFSLFFASLAAAYVSRDAGARGARLRADVEAFLEAVLEDPRWTLGRAEFLAEALGNATSEDLRPLAGGRAFRLVVWDLASDERWTFGGGEPLGGRRTASTSATVRSAAVDPARVTATLWGR